jgi:hypothetical protein
MNNKRKYINDVKIAIQDRMFMYNCLDLILVRNVKETSLRMC